MNKGLYSSNADDWETPKYVFDTLNKEFDFSLDAAADFANRKCKLYINEETNSIGVDWFGMCISKHKRPTVWLNPPYGKKIGEFMKKAADESIACTVVCLIPARTDTEWWDKWVMKADEIRFITGRLKFSGSKNSAPFPSCIVVFRPDGERQNRYTVPIIKTVSFKKDRHE